MTVLLFHLMKKIVGVFRRFGEEDIQLDVSKYLELAA